MYTKISTANMDRTAWLRKRKEGIGGSDAGAICGLNPYAGPIQIYWDKTSSDIEDRDNEAMRQGRELEEYVKEKFHIQPHVFIMGPVIGSHVGPNAFALGYITKSLRNEF